MTRKPLRILHLGKFYPPEFGGIESVTEALAVDQALAGNSVEVLCFTRGTPSTETDGNLSLHRHHSFAQISSQPVSIGYILNGIRRARRTEILHVHTPNILAAVIALFARRETRVVVHWHADIESKGLLGWLIKPIEQMLLMRANAIVATSKAYCDASTALKRHQAKVSIIPIGISNLDHKFEERSIIPHQILFVGRLVPYKGVPVLLRAMHHLKVSAQLKIVGEGPEKEALERLSHDLGIQGKVDFLGKVDQALLLDLFGSSAVFCLPSINRLEAFGVVLLEAMRAGCPSVSSAISGSGVSWVNETGFHFPVSDHVALASHLEKVLTDPHLRKKHSILAQERFVAMFGREKMSIRFLELYWKLLGEREQS